ncbi:dihydrofolate reductase family protein [Hymenobacter latericus]|uniref:dihydrofolate reductase family protein n=1 Tax=Hymenobacter sp. YIM 151858-1 TaxID=2987688 RepID=UPI002227704A|nr:dihydrofolate reductase family protein [Hymenobacter sp. YIM 151858-1]UYZ59067.1 dihydrofolate reductase family protein [Hymenobacter sp. YIM 151858-1]
MPEVVLYIAASLDGYIAAEDGSVDFLKPYEQAGQDYGYAEFVKSLKAVVMGSRTYEQVLGFNLPEWPYQNLDTYVCTKRTLPTSADPRIWLWPDSVSQLAQQLPNEGRTWLVGGGALIDSFNAAGLIDRLLLAVIPVFLGKGVKLLHQPPPQTLLLENVTRYDNGVLMLDYRLQAQAPG